MPSNCSAPRLARALLLAGLLGSSPLSAQGGPWVPVGSRLDGLASWLSDEGGLRALDPLTRPWRLAAVRQAAGDQDSLALRPSARRVLGWLRAELERVADSSAVTAELGVAVYDNGRRDTFREGGSSGGGAMGGIWASLSRGPLVAVINPAFEQRLKDDPEFTGNIERFTAGRLQAGYVAVTGSIGDVVLGRMARQWGPALFQGLQLSPSAYAQDQLVGTVRLGRFELTTLAQRLDDSVGGAVPISRYFFGHRLTINAGRGVWLAFSETGVYGGPGRGFEPAFHAPLGLAMLAQVNEDRRVNAMWGAELRAPLGRGLALTAQLTVDDFQIDDDTITDQRPASGGFTAALSGRLPGAARWTLGYTRVGALTYRNSQDAWVTYTLQGVGLARNFSDYDQALLRVEARPAAAWSVGLDVSYLRQGSGDFRQPFPPDSVLAQPGQGFLVDPVSSAVAARLTLAAEPWRGVMVNGELGVNGEATGSGSGIAALSVSLRFDALRGRLGAPWGAVEQVSPWSR